MRSDELAFESHVLTRGDLAPHTDASKPLCKVWSSPATTSQSRVWGASVGRTLLSSRQYSGLLASSPRARRRPSACAPTVHASPQLSIVGVF